MEFVLNSRIIESEKKDEIKNAIILLHGYGGDGADISSIAYTWRRFIDNTVFLCPNGIEQMNTLEKNLTSNLTMIEEGFRIRMNFIEKYVFQYIPWIFDDRFDYHSYNQLHHHK